MEDSRDKRITAQLAGYTWKLPGYASKVPFSNEDSLTMREVRNVFQLDPEPPQMELNEYICEAVHRKDLAYFSFFLHHFEKRLNGVIYRFLTRNGYDRYDPARFLDYKLEVLQMLLYCLPKFDPEQETEFLKYAKHYIRDGLLFCRMIGEAGSFASLAEYRRVRKIGAIYNDSGKSCAEVVSEFAVQSGYKDESVSADELLTIAQRNRSIVSLYRTEQDEDGEETGEDVTRDDSWNYAEILWNGIQAKAVTAAFEQLSYKEQWYLEKRNAICMTCGRVSPLSTQSTFEDLAVDFEGTTASGAERFYRRTLDKLRLKLLESGVIHTVTLKQTECRKKNKKIAAAAYLYQADNDGEWGELRFDFATGTAEIVKLADWDTTKSNVQLLDAWTNTAAVLDKAGAYAIALPGWEGELPDGVTRVDVPTATMWSITRTVLSGNEDLPNVYAIQEQMQLLPLSAYVQGGEYTAPQGAYKEENDFVPVNKVLK